MRVVHVVAVSAISVWFCVCVAGCGGGDREQFSITFRATSGPDQPIAGVEITAPPRYRATTDANGLAQAGMSGAAGEAAEFRIQCPPGHRTPTRVRRVTLRHIEGLASRPGATPGSDLDVSVQCPPDHRTAAIVVRAVGQEGLPVLIDGEEVGRTDSSGVLHIARLFAPTETFEVRVETLGRALRPSSAVRTFTVADADDLYLLDQNFVEDRPAPVIRRRVRRRRPPAGAHMPVPVEAAPDNGSGLHELRPGGTASEEDRVRSRRRQGPRPQAPGPAPLRLPARLS